MNDKDYTVDKWGNPIPPEPLKPCPFCGDNALFQVGITCFQVKCQKCGIGIRGNRCKALCRAWNKRVKLDTDKKK